jgi:hypothetical protein
MKYVYTFCWNRAQKSVVVGTLVQHSSAHVYGTIVRSVLIGFDILSDLRINV